jgi:hypothetical protein
LSNPSDTNKGCLGSLLAMLGLTKKTEYAPAETQEPDPEPLPYRLRDDFLSPAEKSFYHVARSTLPAAWIICPKVSLADIFFVSRPNENKSANNRINRKHVDFLVCDQKTMQPVFAIELDDSSHSRPSRMERDEFVEEVFETAGLPLVRVPVRMSYSTSELELLFKNALPDRTPLIHQNLTSASREQTAPPAVNTPPVCPKCGQPMLLRTTRTGDQAGRQFYGCSNYPKCRVTYPIN